MRVTHQSVANSVLANLQGNISRLNEVQQRLSSGKQVVRPSDSPVGAVAAMELRTQIASNRQYLRNVDDGLGWLSMADTALQAASEQVIRARGLALQGMSTGSSSPGTREALATEIEQISEALLGMANTTYLDRPVFGGTTDRKLAYTLDTRTYNGDDGTVSRTAGSQTKVSVNVSGRDIFGDGTETVFRVLSDIASKLRTDPEGLGPDLDRLDGRARTIQTGLSVVGARYNQLDRMRHAADDSLVNLNSSLAEAESIDLPKTISDLQLQQTAYQAALAAGARAIQSSLVDFLR